jgi:hypothetical protein
MPARPSTTVVAAPVAASTRWKEPGSPEVVRCTAKREESGAQTTVGTPASGRATSQRWVPSGSCTARVVTPSWWWPTTIAVPSGERTTSKSWSSAATRVCQTVSGLPVSSELFASSGRTRTTAANSRSWSDAMTSASSSAVQATCA